MDNTNNITKISFDTGIREYEVNGNAILRFNPTDLNLYNRLLEILQEIPQMIDKNVKEHEGKTGPQLFRALDIEAKKILSEAFGEGNDFDKIFGGVNIVAKRKAGGTVLEAFIEAILPIVKEGVEELLKEEDEAVEKYAGEYE